VTAKKPRTERRKAYQAATHDSAQRRHAANREAQNDSTRRNIGLRREGKLTPWQAACHRRLALRAAVRAAREAEAATGGRS
jgi:hypothetical protein